MKKPMSPGEQLCVIAAKANTLRKMVNDTIKEFNQVSPKCEWFLTGKLCCSEHHHHKGGRCDLITCPITEIKEDPNG